MREYPKYKKVLFCTDFSENSDYAFDFAFGIAKRDSGLLYILHVLPDNPHQAFAEQYIKRENLEDIQRSIEESLHDKFTDHYVKKIDNEIAYKTIIKSGREDNEILKFVKKEQVDIIIMGTHGRTGIEHVFFGSVAENVLRRSKVPIFIIPCRKRREPL
jgi:nucleotide-binding universal stress UspA family protein